MKEKEQLYIPLSNSIHFGEIESPNPKAKGIRINKVFIPELNDDIIVKWELPIGDSIVDNPDKWIKNVKELSEITDDNPLDIYFDKSDTIKFLCCIIVDKKLRILFPNELGIKKFKINILYDFIY